MGYENFKGFKGFKDPKFIVPPNYLGYLEGNSGATLYVESFENLKKW